MYWQRPVMLTGVCTFVLMAAVGCDGVFSLSGSVCDGEGEPIEDATVHAESLDKSFLFPLDSRTDAKGQFWLETTASAKNSSRLVSITVSKDGCVPLKMEMDIAASPSSKNAKFYLFPTNPEAQRANENQEVQ